MVPEEKLNDGCRCNCHFGGAVSCPGCKENHGKISCSHCK